MKNDVVLIQKIIKLFLFGLSPLNTKQKNYKNVAALLPQNNTTACTCSTCMLGKEISFQVHVPKQIPKLYKILGTKLKGIGIS